MSAPPMPRRGGRPAPRRLRRSPCAAPAVVDQPALDDRGVADQGIGAVPGERVRCRRARAPSRPGRSRPRRRPRAARGPRRASRRRGRRCAPCGPRSSPVRAASASATICRTISAAGSTSATSPADWPVNGSRSSPLPARTAATSCGPSSAGSTSPALVAQALDQRRRHARGATGRPGAKRRQDAVAVLDLDGVERVGGDDARLPRLVDRHLRAGEEARAEARTLGAEHQRGREPATVGDAAGRDDGDVAGDVGHLGDEHHGGHEAAVAAGLTALGDEHVRARVQRLLCLRHGHDLLDREDAGVVRPGDQVRRDGEVEGDRARPARQASRRAPPRRRARVWLTARGRSVAPAAAPTGSRARPGCGGRLTLPKAPARTSQRRGRLAPRANGAPMAAPRCPGGRTAESAARSCGLYPRPRLFRTPPRAACKPRTIPQ